MAAGVRIGGQSYIHISPQLGREAILPLGGSVIGNAGQQKYLRTLQKTDWLGSKISNIIARQVAKVPQPKVFPGFIVSFADRWMNFRHTTGHTIESLSVILEAAYGERAVAEGHFVSSFEEVRALTTTPVDEGVSFAEALRNAYAEGQKMKNGFFVVQVKGNLFRPKDTLVLELSTEGNIPGFCWISVNRSAGHAWEERIAATRQDMQKFPRNKWPSAEDRRDTQGILLKATYAADGAWKEVWLSTNPARWSIYRNDPNVPDMAKRGAEILEAWNKGYYIYVDAYDSVLGFAEAKGRPVFPTLKELEFHLRTKAK